MFGMGMGELVVLALVGLFVIGPERLPGAIRTAAGVVSEVKKHLATVKDQMNSPEFADVRKHVDELREPLAELRAADPRRAMREALAGANPRPDRSRDGAGEPRDPA